MRSKRSLPVLSLLLAVSAAGGSVAQSTARVSVGPFDAEAPGGAALPSAISGDGRHVALLGNDPTIVPGTAYLFTQAFAYDRLICTNALVSVDSSGNPADAACGQAVLSFTGRFVAFVTAATNLSAMDGNGLPDVYLRDRDADGNGCFDETFPGATTTALVSVNAAGTGAGNASSGFNGPAGGPNAAALWAVSISADGNLVAFSSVASDLVPGDTNGLIDIFVRDIALQSTTRVNVTNTGAQALGGHSGGGVAISPDGQWVAYGSDATNLAAGFTGTHVYLRMPGLIGSIPVTAAAGGGPGSGGTTATGVTSFALSTNGGLVAFMSDHTNLVAGGTAGLQCFVRTTAAPQATTLASTGPLGAGNGASQLPALSGDATAVTFTSAATNLLAGGADTNGLPDIYFRDLVSATTTRISVDSINRQGTGGVLGCFGSSTSAVPLFTSYASDFDNLVFGDGNAASDVFLDDRTACVPGNVDSGAGPAAPVLSVNGSSGPVVGVPRNTPFTLGLAAAPGGSGQGRYVVYAWNRLPEHQLPLVLGGFLLGCTVNAVPPPPQTGCALPAFNPTVTQPIQCLVSDRFTPVQTAALVGTVPISPSPGIAPWSVSSPGFPGPRTFTFQGLLEDASAANGSGFSVTNAVTVIIP